MPETDRELGMAWSNSAGALTLFLCWEWVVLAG